MHPESRSPDGKCSISCHARQSRDGCVVLVEDIEEATLLVALFVWRVLAGFGTSVGILGCCRFSRVFLADDRPGIFLHSDEVVGPSDSVIQQGSGVGVQVFAKLGVDEDSVH